MSISTVPIGKANISRLILGGNPFSGFSHQSPELDNGMRHYYTADRMKAEYRRAEELGITTHIGRADHHVMRVLMEHWDEGGRIQWIAQTCPEVGPPLQGVHNGINGRAMACFLHGGQMEILCANNQTEQAAEAIAAIRQAGLPAGIAGHAVNIFDWAEENLDVDFYMCCYYNPTDRSKEARHIPGSTEKFLAEDRQAMVRRIATLSKPAIHYKVLAAGRTPPGEAFDFVARHLRPQDAVCVGVWSQDHPDMLDEDVRLLTASLQAQGKQL